MQIINAGDFESVQSAIDFLSKKSGHRELIIPKGLKKNRTYFPSIRFNYTAGRRCCFTVYGRS